MFLIFLNTNKKIFFNIAYLDNNFQIELPFSVTSPPATDMACVEHCEGLHPIKFLYDTPLKPPRLGHSLFQTRAHAIYCKY